MAILAAACLVVFAALLLALAFGGPGKTAQPARHRREEFAGPASGARFAERPRSGERRRSAARSRSPLHHRSPVRRRSSMHPSFAVSRSFGVHPWSTARRRREMQADVPEVLDVLRATITAGVAPRRALLAASETGPASLTTLLAEAVRACDLGSGAGRALAEAGTTHELTELTLAGEALDLAEQTGAPPGRVLAGVAAAAADRLRSDQARLAATAQARLSARVVAGMAPVFVVVLFLTAPADAAFLVRGRAGWSTLAAAATLEAIGVLWARKIVRGAP
jgi:Flp pilus assembly protein TadB